MATKAEKDDFRAYCKAVTDRQIVEVLRKEMEARRVDYARIAQLEAALRGIET